MKLVIKTHHTDGYTYSCDGYTGIDGFASKEDLQIHLLEEAIKAREKHAAENGIKTSEVPGELVIKPFEDRDFEMMLEDAEHSDHTVFTLDEHFESIKGARFATVYHSKELYVPIVGGNPPAFTTDNYIPVAKVYANDLHEIFMKSQNIDKSWLKNHGVEGLGEFKHSGQARSTSVGDVVKLEGKYYRCEIVDWSEIQFEEYNVQLHLVPYHVDKLKVGMIMKDKHSSFIDVIKRTAQCNDRVHATFDPVHIVLVSADQKPKMGDNMMWTGKDVEHFPKQGTPQIRYGTVVPCTVANGDVAPGWKKVIAIRAESRDGALDVANKIPVHKLGRRLNELMKLDSFVVAKDNQNKIILK